MIRLSRPRHALVFAGLLAAGAFGLAPAPSRAQAAGDFYAGKTIDLYIGYGPGGGYDAYARLVARHLGDFIPGKPKIVPKNMAGGGGRVVAGFIFNVAPKDGTALATADQSLVLAQATGDPTIHFDVNRFNWIGNPSSDNNTAVTWHTTGVKTIDEAKQKEVIVGATGPNTSAQLPQVMNDILGTKFKIVSGYKGGNEMNLAMEAGEIGARGSNPWSSWKATKPEWVKDKKINILVQVGLARAKDLPDVPLMFELAKNDEDRRVLRFLSSDMGIARAFATTPDTPPERLAALRKAFMTMLADPEFLAEAEKQKMDITPSSAEEVQDVVDSMLDAPPQVIARAKSLLGGPGK